MRRILRKFKSFWKSFYPLIGTYVNLVNSAAGAGVLFLPYVMKEEGITFGLIIFCCFATSIGITLYMLSKSVDVSCQQIKKKNSGSFSIDRRRNIGNGMKIVNVRSNEIMDDGNGNGNENEKVKEITCYEDLGAYVFRDSPFMSTLVRLSIRSFITVSMLGCCLIFLILPSGWEVTSIPFVRCSILFVMCITISVLSSFKMISSLRLVSYVTVTSLAILTILMFCIFCAGFITRNPDDEEKARYFPRIEIFPTSARKLFDELIPTISHFGSLTFAFTCHHNIVRISAQFENPKDRHKISTRSIPLMLLTCVFIYSFISLFCYLTFLDNTESDILKSYMSVDISDSYVWNTLKIIMAGLVILICCGSYPMLAYPFRESFNSFLISIIMFLLNCCIRKVRDQENLDINLFQKMEPYIDNVTILKEIERKKTFQKKLRSKKMEEIEKTLKQAFRIITTVGLGLLCYLVAIFWPQAAMVSDILGCTSLLFLDFVFPCLIFIKIMPNLGMFTKLLIIVFMSTTILIGFVVLMINISNFVIMKSFG